MSTKAYFPGYRTLPQNDNVIIEHTLRYGDIHEINEIIGRYGAEKCKCVWEQTLIPDERIKKLNYFLAKFIFKISFDEDELTKYMSIHVKTRKERLNEIFNS
jgi:hypothetical protein